MKFIVDYDPIKGEAVPDGECESKAMGMILKRGEYCISSFLVIDNLRVAVKNGLINPDEIDIYYNGQRLDVNKGGKFFKWPPGFGDYHEKVLYKLVGWDKPI